MDKDNIDPPIDEQIEKGKEALEDAGLNPEEVTVGEATLMNMATGQTIQEPRLLFVVDPTGHDRDGEGPDFDPDDTTTIDVDPKTQ